MVQNTLGSRFLAKLIGNSFNILVGGATAWIFARGLGPAEYGNYNFLFTTFTALVSLASFGTGSAYFNYTSRHERLFPVSLFFFLWVGIILTTLLSGVLLINAVGLNSVLFPDQQGALLPAFLLLALTNWSVNIASGLADSRKNTHSFEWVRAIVRFGVILVLAALYMSEKITLPRVVLASLVGNGLILMICSWVPFKPFLFSKTRMVAEWREVLEQYPTLTRYFWRYSAPLGLYAVLCFVYPYFDRWLLLRVYGSASLGTFALAFQMSTFCELFIISISPLLNRELAISHQEKNQKALSALFQKHFALFVSLSLSISFFTLFAAEELVTFFGGDGFQEAVLPIRVVALVPIFSTANQLIVPIFLATEDTRTFRNISCLTLLGSLGLTYLLLAGLGLGSVGLASKLLITEVVMFSLLFTAGQRHTGVSLATLLRDRGIGIIAIGLVAATGYYLADLAHLPPLPTLLFDTLLCTTLGALILYVKPQWFGLAPSELAFLVRPLQGMPLLRVLSHIGKYVRHHS